VLLETDNLGVTALVMKAAADLLDKKNERSEMLFPEGMENHPFVSPSTSETNGCFKTRISKNNLNLENSILTLRKLK